MIKMTNLNESNTDMIIEFFEKFLIKFMQVKGFFGKKLLI